MITLVRAALQWLGFIDLSAPPPVAEWTEEAPDQAVPAGQIWIGSFVLTGAPSAR